MQITRKEFYLGLALLAALLLGGAYIIKGYMAEQVALTRANQVKQDMQPVHQEAQQQKESAAKAEDVTQKTLALALANLAAQRQQPIVTPVDYARLEQMIQAHMGTPATVTSTPNLPNAPSATMDAKKLQDYINDCDVKSANLEACRQTTKNLTVTVAAEKRDHDATKAELTAARTALNGGTKWTRMRTGLGHSLCGGGGATAGFGMAQMNAKPLVAVGVGAGTFLGCELLLK